MTDMDARLQGRRNVRLAGALVAVVVGMVGLAFAAVPLYDLFCRVTGYGGTTRQADAASERVIEREVVVRFDANVRGLPWSFGAEEGGVRLKVGETGHAVFVAENRSDRPTSGTAIFNVSPFAAGQYFNKIECFCFTEQRLEPGERIEMPVQFFLDPAMDGDVELRSVRTVTLSYTFYPDHDAGQPVAAAEGDEAGKSM
jgi:cytochrome c oxidase assembly protein subunit 11